MTEKLRVMNQVLWDLHKKASPWCSGNLRSTHKMLAPILLCTYVPVFNTSKGIYPRVKARFVFARIREKHRSGWA
jgi:hypothetical protein